MPETIWMPALQTRPQWRQFALGQISDESAHIGQRGQIQWEADYLT
ncbi:hypothetical protein [Mycobacterium noviomagense]|nr:hypothetical protein [Mycobacterium noviomagense]